MIVLGVVSGEDIANDGKDDHDDQKENYDDDYIKIVLPGPVGPVHISRYKRLEAEVKSKLQNFIAKGKSMQHGKNINEKYTILIFFFSWRPTPVLVNLVLLEKAARRHFSPGYQGGRGDIVRLSL